MSRTRRPPHSPHPAPRRDDRFGTVLRWSLLGSVLLHLAFLLLSPIFVRVGLPPGPVEGPFHLGPVEGLRMVELRVVPSERPREEESEEIVAAAIPPRSTTSTTPRTRALRPGSTASSEQPAEAARETGRSPALQSGVRDPRLWVAPKDLPEPPEPTDHERYMAHLESRLNAYNDSVGAASDRARRATDWTVKDKDGKRWGISPGTLHLGDVKIPIPAGVHGDPLHDAAAAERGRQREEILRQEGANDREQAARESRDNAKKRRENEKEKGKPDP